jgi:nucleotide-binding universal stress UspA family protein
VLRNPIVCGVDGSTESRLAARVAAELARALGRRLVLAHAAHDPPTFPYGDVRMRELQRRRLIEVVNPLLEDIAADLFGVVTEPQLVFGEPVEALDALCREQEAELLVVGSRGRSGLTAALLGSASMRLASGGECPVVVVRADAVDRFLQRVGGSVICGVDGSVESEHALQLAAGLADRMRLELVPVFVAADGHPEITPTAGPFSVQVDAGDPVAGTRWRALGEHARLIVVGSRGRGALHGALLGSVSGALAAEAPVPVLVVPPGAGAAVRARRPDVEAA